MHKEKISSKYQNPKHCAMLGKNVQACRFVQKRVDSKLSIPNTVFLQCGYIITRYINKIKKIQLHDRQQFVAKYATKNTKRLKNKGIDDIIFMLTDDFDTKFKYLLIFTQQKEGGHGNGGL